MLKKMSTPRKRIQITKMTKGIYKFLDAQEIYDFKNLDYDGLKETVTKMYAHLPQGSIDKIVESCNPAVDEFDLIDGIIRIPEPDEVPVFNLFGGSKLVVTLPHRIPKMKRTRDKYVPPPEGKPLPPSPYTYGNKDSIE